MAILITNDGDKVVATLADRDAITKKFEGMQVLVKDAIADVVVGGGAAGYFWDATAARWTLFWTNSKDDLIFTTESHTIVNGSVQATYPPASGLVWDCEILGEEGTVVVKVSKPNINGFDINIGSPLYDGLTLLFTYAYGKIQATVSAKIDFTKSSLKDITRFASTPGLVVLDSIPLSSVGTAHYLIQACSGLKTHSTSVTVIHNGSEPFVSEINSFFSLVDLMDVSSDVVDSDLRVLVYTTEPSTTITAVRTLLGRGQ